MTQGKTGENQVGFQVTDRRFWVVDESSLEKSPPPEVKYPSFVEELKARTETAERKLQERLQHLDEENAAYRERLGRQLDRRMGLEKAQLLRDLLEVVDNFERALEALADESSLESFREGVLLNLDLFLKKLKAAGVEPIDNLHRPFDPNESEAIGTVPVEDPEWDEKIMAVVQKGYRLGDEVLRPARVRVGKSTQESY
jgi:molecular chaperone GrpE